MRTSLRCFCSSVFARAVSRFNCERKSEMPFSTNWRSSRSWPSIEAELAESRRLLIVVHAASANDQVRAALAAFQHSAEKIWASQCTGEKAAPPSLRRFLAEEIQPCLHAFPQFARHNRQLRPLCADPLALVAQFAATSRRDFVRKLLLRAASDRKS